MNADFVSELRKGTLAERRALIVQHTGVEPKRLDDIVSQPIHIRDKVILLSKELFVAATSRMDELNAARVISAGTLGAFLLPFENPIKAYDRTYATVNYRFKKESEEICEESGEDICSFMVLRDEALAQLGLPYLSRILAARSTWRDRVNYSQTDTRKGIRLPLVGPNEVFLFGVATMSFALEDGTKQVPKKGKLGENSEELRKKRNQNISVTHSYDRDKTFYEKVVWPIFRSSFNLPPKEKPAKDINSRAIYELFRHTLAYSGSLSERNLLSLDMIQPEVMNGSLDKLKHTYFAGIVSRQLEIEVTKERLSGELLPYGNFGLALQIENLAKQMSLSPIYDPRTNKLFFNHEDIMRLASSSQEFGVKLGKQPVAHAGYLFNPAQIKAVEKYLI